MPMETGTVDKAWGILWEAIIKHYVVKFTLKKERKTYTHSMMAKKLLDINLLLLSLYLARYQPF